MMGNRTIELHNINSRNLQKEIHKFFQLVKEYNQAVKNEELQILPS